MIVYSLNRKIDIKFGKSFFYSYILFDNDSKIFIIKISPHLQQFCIPQSEYSDCILLGLIYQAVMEEVIAAIKKHTKENKGYEYLPEDVKLTCTSLLQHKYRLSEAESISILYDAFLEISKRIVNNTFEYEHKNGFISYLKRTCNSKAKTYLQETRGDKIIVSVEKLNIAESTLQSEIESSQEALFGEYETYYDVDLNRPDKKQIIPSAKHAVASFHQLSEEGKLLIVLKDVLKLSYREMVEALSPFYKIKSEDVCKTKVSRCRKLMRNYFNEKQK